MFAQIGEHRMRFLKSLAMYSVFLMYGLTSGLLGPTMLDLQLRINGTIEQVAYIMPGRSIGMVVGSLISEYMQCCDFVRTLTGLFQSPCQHERFVPLTESFDAPVLQS